MSNMTPHEMVEKYIKLRDYKAASDEAYKKSMARVIEAMNKIEAMLLDQLNQMGVDSLAGTAGTAYRKTQTSVTVEDQVAFRGFIEDAGWDFADVKANKTTVRKYMDDNPGAIVPGVKITLLDQVGIRRS